MITNAINRGEWAGVCLCLLYLLQRLVWPALGDIWGQYTWWNSIICHDLDVFFSCRGGQPFEREKDYVLVVPLQETNPWEKAIQMSKTFRADQKGCKNFGHAKTKPLLNTMQRVHKYSHLKNISGTPREHPWYPCEEGRQGSFNDNLGA